MTGNNHKKINSAFTEVESALDKLYNLAFCIKEADGVFLQFTNENTEVILEKIRKMEYKVYEMICNLEYEIINSELMKMTDKEIIIDGVDVSECEFLWKEKLPKKVCNNGNLDCNCENNPNCNFKQLKRKERAINNIEDIYRTDDSGDYDFVKWKILDLIREVKGVN